MKTIANRPRARTWRSLMHRSGVLACVFVVMLALGRPAATQTGPLELHASLSRYGTLSDRDLAAMERGAVLVKSLRATDDREVAVLGVMRLAVSKEAFIERFRDIVAFKRSKYVTQIGKFSNPPRLEDLSELTLDPDDVASLARCRLRNCSVKLPAAWIDAFRREVDWSEPDAADRANALMRRLLLEYVRTYVGRGYGPLVTYDSTRRSVQVVKELEALVAASPYLAEYAPEFAARLAPSSRAPLPQSDSFLYWSKESFGEKSVVSITHVTIYWIQRGTTKNVLIASRQIYASHYMDASLALTALIDEWDGSRLPTSYLIYMNRTRIDAMSGAFASLRRTFIERRLRSEMRTIMTGLKERFEASDGNAPEKSRGRTTRLPAPDATTKGQEIHHE